MAEIEIPFPLKGIPLKPELTGRMKVDDVLIQTLAALCGWDGEARRLITCALNGALHIADPAVKAIINKVSTGATEDITFSDTETTTVIVVSNLNNNGDVWLNFDANAGVDTGWLLDAGDYLEFSINNLSRLRLHVISNGDKVIILYTV